MPKKRKTGLAIGAVAACITVLCATGACNGIAKKEKAVYSAVTTSTKATTTTTPLLTTTVSETTIAVTTAVTTTTTPQIMTTATCSTAGQGLGETQTLTETTQKTVVADTNVQPSTTAAPATTTAPTSAQPYNGQTSGDYIYAIAFGWVFNEGGGGYGETNYEMYCNGNKIGYFG